MKTDLKRVRLADLSPIEHAYYLLPVGPESAHHVLVVAFAGTYRAGGKGVDDASYMAATTAAGLEAWTPRGLVFDLTHLDYLWGQELSVVLELGKMRLDALEDVLLGKTEAIAKINMPTSIVIGPKCRSAIVSLLVEEMRVEPSDWLFDSLDSAVLTVRRELTTRRAQ